ncbi:MAG: PASTA domain-containing protein, partial [Pseudonocardia sp.]|nr:PASTA domain-containing protein [Pseudonocardia sp.]
MEFEAVRTSRRHGKSWAEIAIRLGVARQSAWERWRDVDEPDDPRRTEAGSPPDALSRIAADELVGEPDAGSTPVGEPSARRRRASSVVVPNVVGMSWDRARRVLHGVGLLAVGTDPDGPPAAELSW